MFLDNVEVTNWKRVKEEINKKNRHQDEVFSVSSLTKDILLLCGLLFGFWSV